MNICICIYLYMCLCGLRMQPYHLQKKSSVCAWIYICVYMSVYVCVYMCILRIKNAILPSTEDVIGKISILFGFIYVCLCVSMYVYVCVCMSVPVEYLSRAIRIRIQQYHLLKKLPVSDTCMYICLCVCMYSLYI
jgi:hypothetical protein